MSAQEASVRLVATPGGRVYVSENDQGSIARALLTKGRYEKEWTKWMKTTVRAGSRALDIGANIGYYTALLATIVGPHGSVVACEPDPDNADLLRRTIAENGFTQVRFLEAAVTDTVGRATLFQDSAWHGVHSLAAENIVNPGEGRVDVATTTIDALVVDTGAFDFVKIDAQGAEAQILRSASRLLSQPHATVLIEVWPRGLHGLGATLLDVTEPFRRHHFDSFTIDPSRELVPITQQDIAERASMLGTWSSFNLVWRK
jgi:FkbM family methyltransferase